MQFDITDFETTYNAFFGRLALSKFMAIPHYAYLVLKMLGPRGVISIRGDVKRAFDYEKEGCETADKLTASVEHQELKQALAESPPNPVMPEAKTTKMSIQPDITLRKMIQLSTEQPSKAAHVGNSLDAK
jgi:hypothetical protein